MPIAVHVVGGKYANSNDKYSQTQNAAVLRKEFAITDDAFRFFAAKYFYFKRG
ncbi:hypothetical protein NVV94_04645 [Pseudomonas sp. LS1212]|uniref:hypothetical protein n=1 Tax=Pseudomonas sp. LS1212 TaxID=2972478 RepID=UPI00215C3BC7|nr:hypothetical protein [Pseudomonas sp. LS1212]UVJ44879.1 hypothetical protein NVV94_04645 [Pseudomonas sp. LS1212]